MKRPNKIDMLVYSFFYWWWNPIFKSNPVLSQQFVAHMNRWLKENIGDYKKARGALKDKP